MAASATFALKAGLCVRRARLTIVTPDIRHSRCSQADFPLIGLSEFAQPPLRRCGVPCPARSIGSFRSQALSTHRSALQLGAASATGATQEESPLLRSFLLTLPFMLGFSTSVEMTVIHQLNAGALAFFGKLAPVSGTK